MPAVAPLTATRTCTGPVVSGSITQPVTRTRSGPAVTLSTLPNGSDERTSTVRVPMVESPPGPLLTATAVTWWTPGDAGTVAVNPWASPEPG